MSARAEARGEARAVPLVGVVLFVAVFTWLHLADPTLPPSGPVLNNADLRGYFVPTMGLLRASLSEGEFPLWNPYQLAGSPFVALHSPAALYPPLLALAPLPPHIALTWHVLIHLVLAGFLTAAFLRSLGASAWGSLIGGLAYAASPPLVSAVHNPAYLATFTWLPAILLGVRSLCDRPCWRATVRLSLALTMCFLGGHAQGFLYASLFAACYGALHLCTACTLTSWPRVLTYAGSAAITTAALSSVQLLPMIAHASDATRDLGGVSVVLSGAEAVHWSDLVASLAGQGRASLRLPGSLLVLLCLALATGAHRATGLMFALLLFVTYDFICGFDGVTFTLTHGIPGLNLFRLPIRMAFAFQFAAATLMGLGASSFEKILQGRRPRWAVATAVLLAAYVATDLMLRNAPVQRFEPMTAADELYGPEELSAFVDTIGYDRVFLRTFNGHRPPTKFGTLEQAFIVPDYDPLLPGAYSRFFDIPTDQYWHGQLNLWPTQLEMARFTQERRLLDLLSVRYYVDAIAPRGVTTVGPVTRTLGSMLLAERPSAVPRAYVVHGAIHAPSAAVALERVRRFAFDPRQAVVVSEPLESLTGGPPRAAEWARIVDYRRNSVTLRAACGAPCILVLTDLYDPDWAATIDGAPARIFRANYLFRGVELTPGEHEIRFTYRPRAFEVGLALTTATAVLIAAGVLGSALRRRA